ncbi:NAD(P)/FAD-dependent oxidoreductase [Parapedobacter sp. DT-150]|uniref:NAD(P)/FAD-dependent oxidoreductase n=1 Tax=Parapedobacter sp. DT-150 TaxID=3396162 RepID=UPI003F1C5371
MQQEIELSILPERIEDQAHILQKGAIELNIAPSRIKGLKIRKRSIDARGKQVVFRIRVALYIDEQPLLETTHVNYANVADALPVIIIGAGPAGLFAALRCLEKGIRPIVLERGKTVQERRRDLAALNKEGLVNPDSNYCFGEGGAGTYSDGKLYTRSNKRGDVQRVLQLLVAHGATEDILVDARPHIGTNKLPGIIQAMRNTILAHGGEIRFNSRVVDIEAHLGQVAGVMLASGEHIPAQHVILATGHSARDLFELFHRKRWLVEPKPFALGVRIEHPQEIIDQAQYHCMVRSEHLPPAYYSLVEQVGGRGVFSFCMCPGGIIAPCATDKGEVVVNGWSPSKRNNPYANSGTVVQVNLQDVPQSTRYPFALLDFQHEVEERAHVAGGGKLVAPAQRMVDFVQGKLSDTLPVNSYQPGTHSAMLSDVLPPFVHDALKNALPLFGKKMKGYFTNEAILVGVESRTSSPVRIPRDKDTLQHPQIKGLYPCGEGAGYAGGIVSAAIDGMNCADAISMR